MNKVYLVQHSYEVKGREEYKIIGIFSSEYLANKIVEEYKKLPGFSGQKNSFFIDTYILDKKYWSDGFEIL